MLNGRKQKSPKKRFLFILRLVIIFIYWGLGLACIFSNKLLLGYPEQFAKYRLAFGLILIFYGLIRFGLLLKNNNEV